MRTVDAVAHYGSRLKVAQALGLSKSAVYAWDEFVPPLQAARIANLSDGALQFDPEAYRDWNRPKRNGRRPHKS